MGEEISLRTASGTEVGWLFRAFSEHSELIAKSSHVDAVLIGSASARKWFPAGRGSRSPRCLRDTARDHRTDPTYASTA